MINEVQIEEDGTRTWVTQHRWITSRLLAAGVVPPEQPALAEYAETVRRAMELHPNWPSLPYMLALSARAKGNLAEAAVYERRWRELDTERETLRRYEDVLREVAAQETTHLVDVGAALEDYARRGGPSAGELFIDFVHLDPVGHVVVATALTRVIVEDVLGLAGMEATDASRGAP
jgi:hypothetical protein